MTTVTLRPNGTGPNYADSLTGAATEHAATSDDSDATYWTDNDVVRCQYGTTTLPSGSKLKSTRMKYRGRSDHATQTGKMSLECWYGSTQVYVKDTSEIGATIETKNSVAWAYDESAFTAGTPTEQQFIDGIEVVHRAYKSYSGTIQAIRVMESYIDVVYVTQPSTTVTAVSPDPYTTSNIVPIAWTNTLDSDGGSQTRYEVKVFTDAQYGAGGFDPDTSTSFWTSGEVVSSSTGANTGALANADTYRAYVRVAQTVNGESHWSAWAYDQFQVSVTTSDVQTVTPVATDASAYITVTCARDTGSSAWEYIEVQRSRDSGATWEDVRSATFVDATGNANSFSVIDYETGNGEAVKYRARATYYSSGYPIVGDWTESSGTESWTSTSAWLKSPLTPANNTAIVVPDPFQTFSYPARVGVFNVIGSTTPVAVTELVAAPTTTLLIDTDTETDSNDVLTLLRDMLLLYCPTNCEGTTAIQYLAVTGTSMTPTVRRGKIRRRWAVNVVEVDPPADPLASAP